MCGAHLLFVNGEIVLSARLDVKSWSFLLGGQTQNIAKIRTMKKMIK